MTVADKIIDEFKKRREEDAVRAIEQLLGHPVLGALKLGMENARTRTRRGVQATLRTLGLPSHADYETVLTVLSRSARKISTLEQNLTRVESLVAGGARITAEAPAPERAAPRRSSARAKKPAVAAVPKPAASAAKPHVRKKKSPPVARPAAAGAPKAKPTDLAGGRAKPQYKARRAAIAKTIERPARSAAAKVTGSASRERLLTPLGAGKRRISDVAVRAKKPGKGEPAALELLSGFGTEPTRKAR